MIAVPPDPPAAVDGPVDGTRATDRQALRAPGERKRPLGLDDEVDVIGLHRELDHAKKRLVCRRDRPLNGRGHGEGA